MLTKYIQAAMHRATYEILEDGAYYGEIEGFEGVYANHKIFARMSGTTARGVRRVAHFGAAARP